jgi:hypothetical protein
MPAHIRITSANSKHNGIHFVYIFVDWHSTALIIIMIIIPNHFLHEIVCTDHGTDRDLYSVGNEKFIAI